MCGFCGIVALGHSEPVNPDALLRMTRRMSHRGPDGEGLWVSPDLKVGFGHRRLSIQDLSAAGAQPMSDVEGSVHITFNGEIYNFPELRLELEAKGYRFRSRTDTEGLLYLYKEYGDKMLSRLDGDFAFAIWDSRARRILLARDPAGVKPIYFALSDNRLVFASEVLALVASGLVAPEIDDAVVYDYLTYLTSPRLKSFVRGVEKLPPGGALSIDIDSKTVRRWRYWDPLPNQVAVNTANLDEEFESLFREAVRKRKLSDVPIGVLFSGGVDSSLNVAEFQRTPPASKVRTFTVGMSNSVNDESERARRIADFLGTEHHEVIISEDDALAGLETIIRAQDEPVSDPVCIPLHFVTKLARETGTIVLQAGEGADEIFCGYDNYRRFLRQHSSYWKPLSGLPAPVAKMAARGIEALQPVWPQAKKVADILDRIGQRREFFMSSAVAFYEREKRALLSEDFRRRTSGYDSYDVVAPLYRHLDENCPDATFLQRLTYLELNQRLPELLLMRVDKIGMANSIEGRVPFLDHKLISFAMSVPDEFKLRDGVSKEPVKRLAAKYMPRDEIYRPKTGFGAPILKWFGGRLGDELRALLNDPAVAAENYVDAAMLRETMSSPLRTVNEAFKLWVVYSFLRWRELLRQEAAATRYADTYTAGPRSIRDPMNAAV